LEVNPCGKVRSCGTATSNCKVSQKNHKIIVWRFWYDLSRYLNTRVASGDDLSKTSIRKHPSFNSKVVPLKTTIDIPIITSYIIKLLRLKCVLWVIIFNLQTSIQLDLPKKLLVFNYDNSNQGHILWGKFEGNWVWGVKG